MSVTEDHLRPAVEPPRDREWLPAERAERRLPLSTGLQRNEWLYAAGKLFAALALKPFFRLTVEGSGNLPREGGYVLLPKHQRWEDIPLLGLACPHPLYYVAKHELFAAGLNSWFLKSLGGVPLHRRNPLKTKRYLRDLIRLVTDGHPVALFPEGTYFPGTLGPGQTGLIRFILKRCSPLFVPVGIAYAQGRAVCGVRIRFGRASSVGAAEHVEAFMARMMRQIADLSGLS